MYVRMYTYTCEMITCNRARRKQGPPFKMIAPGVYLNDVRHCCAPVMEADRVWTRAQAFVKFDVSSMWTV